MTKVHWMAAATLAALLQAAPVGAQETSTPAAGDPCADGARLLSGVCLIGQLSLDGFANLRGGVRQGVAALAQLDLSVEVDLETTAGLDGWSFRAGVFGIFGRQATPTLIGSLAPVSGTEALPALRLSELWLERRIDGIGSLRFGQLAADTEFLVAEAAEMLTNGSFGWPLAVSTTLPSTGPAYPFRTPGIRLALGNPDETTGLRLAVLSGDPGGRVGQGTDPQRHNRFGTNFSFAGGTFYLAEAATGAKAPARDQPRPWVLKLGAWRHTGGFDDQRGRPVLSADSSFSTSSSTERPVRRRHGNHGFYVMGEATLWRGGPASLAAFARISATPADRNPLPFYADAGLAWRQPFGREGDTLSLGVIYARRTGEARAQDRILGQPLRDREVVTQLTYDLQLMPDRLFIRPLLQWVSHPNAGVPDDRVKDGRLRDAITAGVRLRLAL